MTIVCQYVYDCLILIKNKTIQSKLQFASMLLCLYYLRWLVWFSVWIFMRFLHTTNKQRLCVSPHFPVKTAGPLQNRNKRSSSPHADITHVFQRSSCVKFLVNMIIGKTLFLASSKGSTVDCTRILVIVCVVWTKGC